MISSEAFYKILVLGSDGSGKTTLIDSLLDRSLRKKRRTVVYDAYPYLLETPERNYPLQIFELHGTLMEH